MKIRLVGAQLFRADMQAMKELRVVFRNFANAPKNLSTDRRF
jgi:hypothetical protein